MSAPRRIDNVVHIDFGRRRRESLTARSLVAVGALHAAAIRQHDLEREIRSTKAKLEVALGRGDRERADVLAAALRRLKIERHRLDGGGAA